MRHFTETEIPEKVVPIFTERAFSHVSCDLCGTTLEESAHRDLEIKYRKSYGTSWAALFDLCNLCFKSTVAPFLESKSKAGWEFLR